MGEIVATDGTKFSHRMKETSIYDLEKKGILGEIQEKLHKVTKMAFAVVDYRGEPVTEFSGCTDFCSSKRNHGCHGKSCCLSNAFGGVTAAIVNRPYVYRCPSGLVDVAIPIVIDRQYLGALLGGQVRCREDSGIDDFGNKFGDDFDWKQDGKLRDQYEKIPVLSIEEVENIADLAFFLVKQMCEKESVLIEKKGYERKMTHFLAESRRVKEKEKQLKEMALRQDKGGIHPRFMLDVLNALQSLAYIEGAAATQRMTELLIQMSRYQLRPDDDFVSLDEELENARRYLEIQKLRFEDKLDYEIVKEDGLDQQMILPKTLLPFVENAVIRGVLARKGKGRIRLLCYREKEDCVIAVEDQGSGFTAKQIAGVYGPFRDHYENLRAGSDVYMTRQRLMKKYGSEYDVELGSCGEEGTRITVRIPRFAERMRRYV